MGVFGMTLLGTIFVSTWLWRASAVVATLVRVRGTLRTTGFAELSLVRSLDKKETKEMRRTADEHEDSGRQAADEGNEVRHLGLFSRERPDEEQPSFTEVTPFNHVHIA